MALVHDFVIVDNFLKPQILNGNSQEVEVSDYLIQYISDSLKWLKTKWNNNQDKDGLNYYGESLIDSKNILIFKKISRGWISVFQNSPKNFTIKGNYLYEEDEYEEIEVKREELLNQLQNLVYICDCALENNLYILHKGI